MGIYRDGTNIRMTGWHAVLLMPPLMLLYGLMGLAVMFAVAVLFVLEMTARPVIALGRAAFNLGKGRP